MVLIHRSSSVNNNTLIRLRKYNNKKSLSLTIKAWRHLRKTCKKEVPLYQYVWSWGTHSGQRNARPNWKIIWVPWDHLSYGSEAKDWLHTVHPERISALKIQAVSEGVQVVGEGYSGIQVDPWRFERDIYVVILDLSKEWWAWQRRGLFPRIGQVCQLLEEDLVRVMKVHVEEDLQRITGPTKINSKWYFKTIPCWNSLLR